MRGYVVFEENRQYIDVDKSLATKIHADAAPTTKVDGMLTVAWTSLHGKGTTKETRNIFTTIPKSWGITFRDVVTRLAWAFNALIDGIYPSRDWRDKPVDAGQAGRVLAGGWRLAPLFCVSDLSLIHI